MAQNENSKTGTMNRRSFFGAMAGAAALTLDPDRLLWVPGAKTISIPKLVKPTEMPYSYLQILAVAEYQREWNIRITQSIEALARDTRAKIGAPIYIPRPLARKV